MTSSTLLTATTPADVRERVGATPRDDARGAIDDEVCVVCPHPHADHDAIASRFCTATGTGTIARGCVCRS